MFDTLNTEARHVVYLMIETGLRPEACALDSKTIHLNGPIPFVLVQDENREIKTPGSAGTVPLVGVALDAMKLQLDGFPRYRNRADVASAIINKALRVKDLRPGGKMQTLYSLRHTLIAVGAPRDIQEDLLGHAHVWRRHIDRAPYHWLQRIAFKPPPRI